ncbi:MAG: outer membrane beta-barrel protein [Deltaproteobacteria bacterium]
MESLRLSAAIWLLVSAPLASADEPMPAAAPPPSSTSVKPPDPFGFADFTWLNGNSRQTEFPLDSPAFTGEFQLDTNYVYDFANPIDHTLTGSTNSGRTSELEIQQLGAGGDFHWKNVRARFMTQFGMYSTMTPRNDASVSRGQWDLAGALRYVSEANGGYHFDVLDGLNVDAGLFMSYIGLCSYYDYENWVYQMSYVSANTPWFFNGVRMQLFPTDHVKVELWIVNGWQSYGMFNEEPGVGMELLWRPNGALSFVSNEYVGADTLGVPDRHRFHSDDSAQVKYWDRPSALFDKAAFSLTVDAGCESGGGVSCTGGSPAAPSQYFLGFMAYNRVWFDHDLFAFTFGGGAIDNPGRYLVLLPPINGATAFSGTPYFTTNPGDQYAAWDGSVVFDYLPSQFLTLRTEFVHRQSSVPYFACPGGVTPPGGNQGGPGSPVVGWQPDLLPYENRIDVAMMVRM